MPSFPDLSVSSLYPLAGRGADVILPRLARLARLTGALPLLCASLAAGAAPTVITSLPSTTSADWTTVVFSGTEMTNNGSSTTLRTAESRGVWFGNSSMTSDTPAWTLGDNDAGNYLRLEASFANTPRDWSAYLYDRTHYAAFSFAPSPCTPGNCYGSTAFGGVSVAHDVGGVLTETRFAVDLSEQHVYEFLLRDEEVFYRIDGQLVLHGRAWQTGIGGADQNRGLLVIGDGSGSTLTGTGSMTVHALRFEAETQMSFPTQSVPEPGSAALVLGGLAAMGWRRRARRAR